MNVCQNGPGGGSGIDGLNQAKNILSLEHQETKLLRQWLSWSCLTKQKIM